MHLYYKNTLLGENLLCSIATNFNLVKKTFGSFLDKNEKKLINFPGLKIFLMTVFWLVSLGRRPPKK